MEQSLYQAVGGAEGVLRLAEAWHQRCLADPVVSHAFSHPGQHPRHVERLAAYWGEQLGGPGFYTAGMGDHSCVVRMHSGTGARQEMDERANLCFALALADAGLEQPRLRRVLTDWFAAMIQVMSTYVDNADDVPEDMPLPVWTWHGPSATA